jgi:protein-S-isoprenylcysteine O-methyltransferase Ste14
MMQPEKDRPAIIAPPPLIMAICIAAGFIAHYFKPIPIIPGLGIWRFVLAAAVLVLAVIFIHGGIRQLVKHNEHPSPYKPTGSIVAGGIYRITRNPIYVGFLAVVITVAIAANSAWLLLSFAALFVALHFGVIKPEERYLSVKFGDSYDNYRKVVRRWI